MIFTVMVSKKGQMTLPAPARKKMKLTNGGWVLIEERNGSWVMRSVVGKKEEANKGQIKIWDSENDEQK